MEKEWIMKNRGFTLIELLIVVAIIAILAAIAVPNFLEAQTRSKVARVKSDLRSLNLAFMAYYTDNQKVPPDGNDVMTWSWQMENPGRQPDFPLIGDIGQFYAFRYFARLTTPVAYMTSIPHDAFTRRMPYGYDTLGQDPCGYCIAASCGPDTIAGDWLRSFGTNTGSALAYDPTNGTKSRGDIWRAMIVLDQDVFKTHYPFDFH